MLSAEQWGNILNGVIQSGIFSLVGILFFALTFLLIKMVVPFSIRKEIEEDQNTALGIVIGAVFIGVAIIVAAAITG